MRTYTKSLHHDNLLMHSYDNNVILPGTSIARVASFFGTAMSLRDTLALLFCTKLGNSSCDETGGSLEVMATFLLDATEIKKTFP